MFVLLASLFFEWIYFSVLTYVLNLNEAMGPI